VEALSSVETEFQEFHSHDKHTDMKNEKPLIEVMAGTVPSVFMLRTW